MALDEPGKPEAIGRFSHAKHRDDEAELPDFHADIEGEQRKRHVARRKSDVDQCTGESKSVNQARTKRRPPTAILS